MPDIAAAAGTPVAFDPVGTSEGGSGVVAGNPDVSSAVPAVEAGYPYPVGVLARDYGDNLNGARWRWANADDDLCTGSRGSDR
jgi:hypothetical protein